jgi:ribonuclease R
MAEISLEEKDIIKALSKKPLHFNELAHLLSLDKKGRKALKKAVKKAKKGRDNYGGWRKV